MNEPAYVSIAGEYARRIRSGALPPRTRLPSHAEIADQHSVSNIVVRKAVDLLQRQGLVRAVHRGGVYVADRPNLVRVSPERQLENPEATFGNESTLAIRIERETEQVAATTELAQALGVSPGDLINLVITRASEDGRPISISDTYQPPNVADTADATVLEETLTEQLPTPPHAEWLRVTPGDLVMTVRQRFLTASERVIMLSTVSYPRDRYDAFVFRMTLASNT